jgi:hypothetical protein
VATTVRRRVAAGLLAWLGGCAVAVAIALPESCPSPTGDQVREAATAAVGWLGANQAVDGSFLYRYDQDEGVLPGYNTVRHAGILLALEQADRTGIPGARVPADRGLDWALARLRHLDGDRTALSTEVGGTALLAVALVERRRGLGDHSHDELLGELGRFLVSAVTDEGAVVAQWDLTLDEPVEGSRSPFYTGETMLALARLHAEFPGEGWDVVAREVSHYTATRRDDAERRLPPVSDHWGSYGFDEIAAWPTPLDPDEQAYARRQAGLLGLQVRYESQRRSSGLARLIRGPFALPSGLGTLGEGLGGMWRLAGRGDYGLDRDLVAERLRCATGMIVARQTHSDDPRSDGAWFRPDVTQMDDEQHSLSALIAVLPVLEAS